MTVHLLSKPPILRHVHQEPIAAIPETLNQPSIREIEQLPYLSAVITEGLRLATSQRQTRIGPHEVMTFKESASGKVWHIPPGASQPPIPLGSPGMVR